MKKENIISIIGIIILITGIIISGIKFFSPKKGYTVTGVPVIDSKHLKTFKNQEKLKLITPDNDNEAYHPKIVAFDQKWNGYKYWIAFTPYHGRNAMIENPVINFSNDLETWYTYEKNEPLDVPDISDDKHYNSDTHLLYNESEDQLELFWRYVNEEDNKMIIYKMTSKDGVHWTEKEEFLKSNNRKEKDYVSPAIILENGVYKVWYVAKKAVFYLEKKGDTISKPKQLNIVYENGYKTWHIDVAYNKEIGKYEMVTVAYFDVEKREKMFVYYTSSADNETWSTPVAILGPTNDGDDWNSQGLYRSSILYYNDKYYVFYSGHNAKYDIGVGLACATKITELEAC